MKKTRPLSVLEKQLLLGFLEELSDRFGNDGCNDYSLPNDAANRLLMERAIRTIFSPEDHKQQLEWLAESGKKIITMNTIVLDYLAECVAALPTQLDSDADLPVPPKSGA